MSRGINKCIFVGNLTADPETRYAANGNAVCNYTIAVTKKWKDDERTEFVRCVGFGKLGEIVGQYARKGTQVYTEGEMQTRKWQDKDGNDRYTTEIKVNEFQMLGGKQDSGGKPEPESGNLNTKGGGDDFFQDIPFAKVDWRLS